MADTNTVLRVGIAVIGLMLSIYSLNVEIKASHNKNYKAFCDINEQISCTKVFMSKYGRGFGLIEPILGKDSIFNIPNPVFGIGFYGLVVALCLYRSDKFILKMLTLFSVMSCVMSIYLACILWMLQDMCIVCISTYVVNFSLFYLNFKRLNDIIVIEKYKLE